LARFHEENRNWESDERGDTLHDFHQYRTAVSGVEAVSLKSTRQFPRHSHDQFGIGVMTSGGHRSWSSVGWVEAIRGDIIMVNPGEMHDGSSLHGNARGWKMLYFDPEIVFESLGDEERYRAVALRPTVQDRDQSFRFGRLFNAITNPQPDLLRIEEDLVTVITYAFMRNSSQRPLRLPTLPSVSNVLKLIDCEPEKPLSLREMGDLVGVNRFHFLRGFARVTGVTPHAYILQRRVRLARRLLLAGHEVAQASTEAGFNDQSHMTRAFVRQLGTTPGRYRQAVYGPKSRAISFKTKA
jgi:AraC-like DNA-binding protein/quercetin dioxygenase-like cupin family protein